MEGRVWKYGDDVNTDLIYPGRYTYIMLGQAEMGSHALEDLDPAFTNDGQPGDILVAGFNWGCGSAREQAVKALTARGVAAVVAKSFSRIYFRNALNEGLPAIVCPQAVDAIENGQRISIDLASQTVQTPAGSFHFPPFDPYIQGIMADGGLIPHIRKELGITPEKK